MLNVSSSEEVPRILVIRFGCVQSRRSLSKVAARRSKEVST